MKVLIIGSGGREHTIVQACLASPLVKSVIAAPGNGGMAMDTVCRSVDIDDVKSIVTLAKEEQVDFVIIGPETPLCLGVIDELQAENIPAFGPNRKAARMEGSKVFAKQFLAKYAIPTADSATFSQLKPALDYLGKCSSPIVIKADGLAGGKGVIIPRDKKEAETTIQNMLSGKLFGESGNEIVIEDYLQGEEATIHIIVSGEKYLALPPSQDHKRIGENDIGLNTGGMGAYAPASVVSDILQQQIIKEIIEPTLVGMKREDIDYHGVLYIGIMITDKGPKVIEFNVRFGDPETQVLLPLIDTDPIKLMYECATNNFEPAAIKIKNQSAIVVVLASQGYPEAYPKGETINFPDYTPENINLIHAGTSLGEDGEILTNGGRVLGVTAFGKDLETAARDAYAYCEQVRFPSVYYRRDIGARELRRQI
jgi:phosphoribosylamine--glycine ligase